MKRSRSKSRAKSFISVPPATEAAGGTEQRGQIFTCASIDSLDPHLSAYLHGPVAQSARFDKETQCYKYTYAGAPVTGGGLLSMLKWAYYPKYDNTTKKRRAKGTKLTGSTAAQGKQVDSEIALMIEGRLRKKNKKPHPMAQAIVSEIRSMGHEMQAAQVPVVLAQNVTKMTQADLITRDAFGHLWLFELKSGQPVGFHRKQAAQTHFNGKLAHVECTGLNIWHLQLHHTRMALEAAKVPIKQARIIQVYKHKDKGLVVKVHEQPEWVAQIARP